MVGGRIKKGSTHANIVLLLLATVSVMLDNISTEYGNGYEATSSTAQHDTE